jgi:oxepin-CoA hydrolase / 3-oxo-5,6-dehydrosuberyl-CoA semialdehyde dehydrogenase
MKTIRFDVNDPALREAFLGRQMGEALASLQPSDPPRWGKMTALQMVEHLLWSLELSTGRTRIECPLSQEKQERAKAFLHDNRPMMHEFMNPLLKDGLPALRHASLAEAAAALQQEAGRFLDQARRDPGAVHTHPVFGPLGLEEWSRSHFKHGCHHLLQFGLVDVEA